MIPGTLAPQRPSEKDSSPIVERLNWRRCICMETLVNIVGGSTEPPTMSGF